MGKGNRNTAQAGPIPQCGSYARRELSKLRRYPLRSRIIQLRLLGHFAQLQENVHLPNVHMHNLVGQTTC